MAFFHIYGDDSGKLAMSDYTSFCGYVAHISEWQRFSLEWNNCRLRWGVPAVHMARIMFPEKKDDDWRKTKDKWGVDWETKRDLMLQDFAATIRNAQVVCVGAVVDAKHFRLLAERNAKFKEMHKDPIHLSFHTLVMRGIEKTETIDKCSAISICVDDDPKWSMALYEQLNGLKQNFPKVRERVHSMCFLNDVSYPGLQASDMISYEARRLMVKKIENPEISGSELYDSLTLLQIHQPKFYGPAALDALEATLIG
jgi:hypothetical protein